MELTDTTQVPNSLLAKLPPHLRDIILNEAADRVASRVEAHQEVTKYSEYEQHPIEFSKDILGADLTDDVKLVMESVRDNQVTIAKSGNATGKTHGSAHVAVWWYKAHLRSATYTTAAPPFDNLKTLLWGEIGALVERKPHVFAGDQISSMVIKRAERQFIKGVAIPTTGTESQREGKFSGKHQEWLLFIVDEGDAVPEEVYKGIESCMSGGVVRLLIMFNPRARRGSVWTKERDRQAKVVSLSAFNHPNVREGKNIVPGAVSREITIRRINEWTRPLVEGEKVADDEKFVVPSFLVGETTKAMDGREYPRLPEGERKIKEPQFSYMVLGKYPAVGANQLISLTWIQRARANWDMWVARHGEKPPEGIRPIMGLDVAEFGSDNNALCARYGSYVEKINVWNGIDSYETAERALSYVKEKNAIRIHVDSDGVGSTLAPYISRRARDAELDLRAFPVKAASAPLNFIKSELGEFKQMRDQLWWAMREWLRTDPNAMLPPDEQLLEELSIPTYGYLTGKIKVMKKDDMRPIIKRSPDRAESLMMTFHPMKRAKVLSMGEIYDDA